MQINEPFSVKISSGEILPGKAGDWLLQAPDGVHRVVDAEIFKKTYEVVKENQPESTVKDEEMPSVKIEKMRLFHGSTMEGLKVILPAVDNTVGHGTYFTAERHGAEMYALLRSRGLNLQYDMDPGTNLRKHIITPTGQKVPVVYEVEIENLKLADIRSHENLKKTMLGFRDYLIELKEEPLDTRDSMYYWHLMDAIGTIDILEGQTTTYAVEGKTAAYRDWSSHKNTKPEDIEPKYILDNLGKTFTDYLTKKGYDGVIVTEGREWAERGGLDSYVIFDPEKIKIVETVKIVKSETHSEVLK